MLRRVDLVRTDVTWRNIPEDGILHSHRRENLKSYKEYFATIRNEYGTSHVLSQPFVRSSLHSTVHMREETTTLILGERYDKGSVAPVMSSTSRVQLRWVAQISGE
jgi:hypothetical protein